MRIPLSSPDITEAEIDAVSAVLRTNSLSLGPKLIEFEEALAAYHQVPYAVAVSSGTAALHLAIRALDISEGDEVIVPSFSFVAVANAVLFERATPIFADIDPITLNLAPDFVESLITSRTKAILVVHTFGVPANMTELLSIATRHRLAVIEDACEAIGAPYKNQLVGTFGEIATFAFYPNKQMTTGEGGALLTRDKRIADRIRAMRNQGRYPSNDWLQHTELGFNYRLSEMACALGLTQLNRLPEILAMRRNVADMYDKLLTPIRGIERPPIHLPDREISWFVYVIRIASGSGSNTRDRVLQCLQHDGIGCARYFAPIHLQPAYDKVMSAQNLSLPVTELVGSQTLALPFHNRLTSAEAEQVTDSLTRAMNSEDPESTG